MKPRGPEATAGYWINRASRLLVREGDARLRPHGLAMSYLPVLRALAEGPRSQKELAAAAGVEQSSMAETLVRMERDEMVRRDPHPDDGRTSVVSLTRLSRARFPKAMASLMEGDARATAGLTDEEKTVLRDLLERVVRNLEAT